MYVLVCSWWRGLGEWGMEGGGAWGEERCTCMHTSASVDRGIRSFFYTTLLLLEILHVHPGSQPAVRARVPPPPQRPSPLARLLPPSLDRTYLVGLAADASGLSGLLRTDSSEWSARGGGLAYIGKAARAPAGRRWWSLEEGWAGARAGVGLGRRREGRRKARLRLEPHRSKINGTRLESPWPCRMVPVWGWGMVFECQNRGKYHGIG